MTFNVRIFLPDGVTTSGTITYASEGPKLSNTENQPIDVPGKSIEFVITDEDTNDSALIDMQDRIVFDSMTYYRKLIRDQPVTQDHYPLSTRGWIRHFSQNGHLTRIDLQKIKNSNRYLLSCVDVETGEMFRFHSIKSFEANILKMETDWELHNKAKVAPGVEEVPLEKLLEAPAPSWEELQSLVQGISIPNLQRKETAGETLSQLVPTSFPEYVRKEIMVFLAWTIRASVPIEDPLDFLETISRRFESGPRLRSLIFGHIQCLMQGIHAPQYVRLFALAERGSLTTGGKTQTEDSEQESWNKVWFRVEGLFPNRNNRILNLTHNLNSIQEIHTNLPISKEQAAKSKEAWLDRFALTRSNFQMRGYVQDRKIGLEKIVYIGGAHRWPHTHLQYAARLGHIDQKPPYIQVMVMPKTAVDRISRIKQNLFSIDWTTSRINFNLFNSESSSWKYNTSHFLKSFNTERTRKQLDKQFELTLTPDVIPIDEQDTKLLDLLSWGLYPFSYETGFYDDILSTMSDEEIRDKIGFYLKEKIIHLQYAPNLLGLVSICFEIRGPLKQLYSISRASLKHLPSATVMLSTSEELCIVMARVPENEVYSILTEIPAKVKDYGITMKAYRVSAYAGYNHNVYQRLRRSDGTWDDDVSGLLSQITK
ncbi:MAG: hypothetical protein RTU63_07760 [Candidatus Thorarchaeota archaeon]